MCKGDILKKIVSILLATVIAASSVVMAFAKPILIGDTNNDGVISATDARNILLVVAGLKKIEDNEISVYDVDENGVVAAADARKVLKIVAGLEEEPTTEESTTEESTTEELTTEPTTESTTVESTTEELTTEKPSTDSNSEKERMLRVLETEFLRLVNEERVKNGRNEITENEILHKAARLRAAECLEYFSHTRPNGERYYSILQGELAYNSVHIGENIAWFYESPFSTPDWETVLTDQTMKDYAMDFFTMFKNSPQHYDNILYREFTETGFGVVIVVTANKEIKVACSHLFGTPA